MSSAPCPRPRLAAVTLSAMGAVPTVRRLVLARPFFPSGTRRAVSARPSSSMSAKTAYKALRRRQAPPPVPGPPAAWSAPAAVSSILYETPPPSSSPPQSHILSCLVQDEPGVLSRVSGILAARGFNIDSLVVCNTQVDDLSRMTIVLRGHDNVVEQARRQLEDLVPVWAVLNYTNSALVQRELLLAKINILGPEYFAAHLDHHRGSHLAPDDAQLGFPDPPAESRGHAPSFNPQSLPDSDALRLRHEYLMSITYFTHQFGGKVLDISAASCTVEVSAKPSRIDSFLKLVIPFGILESARTGLMALPRSPFGSPDDSPSSAQDAESQVDATQLPPG